MVLELTQGVVSLAETLVMFVAKAEIMAMATTQALAITKIVVEVEQLVKARAMAIAKILVKFTAEVESR